MASFQIIKFYRLCGAVVVTALVICVLVFGVSVVPITAKKINNIEKHVTSPVRMVLTHQNELLISDYQSRSVIIADPHSLNVKDIIKIKGRPIAVSAYDQWIYVGNEASRQVEVYDRKGKLKMTIGDGQIALPNDIAIDHLTGHVFVVDTAAKKVRVYSAQGHPVGTLPAANVSPALESPTSIEIDPVLQRVYISDLGPSVNIVGFSNRSAYIHIYGYSGNHITSFDGDFTRPQGITINPDKYLYIADGMLGKVLVFDLNGNTLVKTIGSPGSGAGQLLLPLDVAINADSGDLLVANNRNARIEVYVGGGVAP